MSTAIETSLFGLRMDKRYHNWTKKKQAMYTLTYEIQTQTTVIYHYREQSLEGSFFSAIWSNIVFHRGFKQEKTDESTRPQAECFYCFRVFEIPMKHEARVFKITSPTMKFSLNYHLNKFSQFNYIFETWNMHEPQKNVYDVHGPIT